MKKPKKSPALTRAQQKRRLAKAAKAWQMVAARSETPEPPPVDPDAEASEETRDRQDEPES